MTAEVFQSSDMVLGRGSRAVMDWLRGSQPGAGGRGGVGAAGGSLTCRGQHGSCDVQLHHLVSDIECCSWRERRADSISILSLLRAGPPKFKYSSRSQSKTPVVAHSL